MVGRGGGEKRNECRISVGRLKEGGQLEDLDVDGR